MPAIFVKLEKIKPIYDWTYKICLFLCKVFLIADILITTLSVCGRYIPFIPDPSWSEQIVLTLMSYMAVLSAALAIRKGTHIRMTAFDRFLPPTALKVLDLLSDIAVLALGIIMVKVGWIYAVKIGAVGSYESIPGLSRFWMYFPIPMAGFFMIIFELEAIFNHVKAFFVKEEA